ncbi:hypothetical protein [Actinoplanes derwentensis]|uniref:hypothetical protein n=1 Tax=Actinoplanes derwentensis TaxID=113562 RepID=UPI0012FD8F17|nr:hypothetical protein [Actinoplanes derwentensis]
MSSPCDWWTCRHRTNTAPAAIITVRAGNDEPMASLLDFLEHLWGLRPLPRAVPGQKRILIQVDETALRRQALRRRRVIGRIDRLWTTTSTPPRT